MPKKEINKKSKPTSNNIQKQKSLLTKKILFSANLFYFLIVLGFFLTTNNSPTILTKYTLSYTIKLIGLMVLAIPYNLLILFLNNDSIKVSINKREHKISIIWRIIIILICIVMTILFSELFIRMKPKPYVENFHPFLQFIPTKKNESSLHINSDSFRYDEISKKKPSDVYRIFIIGGSTVFDKDRPYEKSLVKQVENSLRKEYPNRKIQVINAGYERYTSEHSLIVFETKVADYDPDLIFIFQGFNDLIYSCTPDFSPIKTYKNDYSHFYQVLSNVIDNYFNWKFQFISVNRLFKGFKENFYSDLRSKLPSPKPEIKYTDEISFPSLNAYTRNMNHIVKLAKAEDVKVIMGNQANHYNNDPKNYGLAQFFCKKGNTHISTKSLNKGMSLFNEASRKIADENDIPFVDIESQIPKNSRFLTDDVHYTNEGDNKVADIIFKAIVKSSYLNE